MLWRTGDFTGSDRLTQELGDGTGYGTPLGLYLYNFLKADMEKAAEWAAKAIDQRDPNTLPAICGPNRMLLEASGHWRALARMLSLPEVDMAISSL